MTWDLLETMFNRAIHRSFSLKKWWIVFPVLLLCGLIVVIFRSISLAAGSWVQMSLAFLPLFLCFALFLALGLVLIPLYQAEGLGQVVSYRKTIQESIPRLLEIVYLVLPLVFVYLILWMILGVFYLLRIIPAVGHYIGSIVSFGPFLLVLGALVLGMFSLLILFLLPPVAMVNKELNFRSVQEVLQLFRRSPFRIWISLLFALIPLIVVVGILSLAAVMTGMMYVASGTGLVVVFQWFFMMLPYAALLTPIVIFFFQFAWESHQVLWQKQ